MAEEVGIEHQIECTMRSRLQHFKDQADSLTMAIVRRLLEEDLGLEKFALDVHKKFIKQNLEKLMEEAGDGNSKSSTENVDKDVDPNKEQKLQDKSPIGYTGEVEELMEDSPTMDVASSKPEHSSTEGIALSEERIEKAIWERAEYFLANSEDLTLAKVRRLLEEDLGLEKNALDPFKKFISQLVDQVLNPPKAAKSPKVVNKKMPGSSGRKKMEKFNHEEGSDASDSEGDKAKEKGKPRNKAAPRQKDKVLEKLKKRKSSNRDNLDDSRMKQKSPTKRPKKEDSDSDDHGNVSEDDQSEKPVKKAAQKKDTPAPTFGKKVEHLKSIIKACGMSVAPTVYKKAKQVPDNKREAFLVEELEGILSKEGLSKNPSEKEIKDCKKRKETARELEGIDMSNIMSSSRRRSSTFNSMTPKPETHAEPKKIEKKKKPKEDKNKELEDAIEEKADEKDEEESKDEEVKVEEESKMDEEGKDEEVIEEVEEDEEDDEDEESNDSDDGEEEDESEEEFNGDDEDGSD